MRQRQIQRTEENRGMVPSEKSSHSMEITQRKRRDVRVKNDQKMNEKSFVRYLGS